MKAFPKRISNKTTLIKQQHFIKSLPPGRLFILWNAEGHGKHGDAQFTGLPQHFHSNSFNSFTADTYNFEL